MVDSMKNPALVWMNFLKDGLNNGDPTVIGVVVASIIVLLTIVILACVKGRGSKRRGVLLLGCCDAGKTLLFTRLVNKSYKQTFTSITANSGTYNIPDSSKSLRIIDLPGHERVRLQMLDNFKDLARAIIFVIDSSSITKDIKDVAEYLYTVLSDSRISSAAPPVLIACNKQDLTFSKGAKVIQPLLEKEMNTLRVTRSAALRDISTSGNNNTFLGKQNKDFSFSDLKTLWVEFAESKATSGKNTLRVTRSAALQDISTSGNNNTYLGKHNKDFSFSDLRPIRVEFAEFSALGKDEKSEPDMGQIEDWIVKVA